MGTLAAGQTVLVVDDDPAIVSFSVNILKQAGFKVLQATGSSDALKLSKNHQGTIDILVTDLVLPPPEFSFASGDNEFPHVHGHDLAIRMLRTRTNLHIVLMSGHIEKELAGYGLRRSSLPLLQKPFQPQALVEIVKQVLQNPPPQLDALESAKSAPKSGDEWFD
ncbi:MAG TPA: response regulator [Nitrospiraceae bacterium]|jgi:DNA-binding NtrC family response regulator